MDHHPPPAWVEILEQKSDGRRISESSGGSGRSGSGGENSGHQRQRKEDINPDVDPRLRVMDRFRGFYEFNRDGITQDNNICKRSKRYKTSIQRGREMDLKGIF